MTKREMIDEILSINLSAEPQFLARFGDNELFEYLTHLRVLSTPRLTGNADRYEKYFRNLPRIPGSRPPWRCDTQQVEEVSVDEQADLDCLAQPADDAPPADAALEPDHTCAAPARAADVLAVTPDECPAAEPAPQPDAAAEAGQAEGTAVAEDDHRQELVAQDVDLAVGQAEREQLLSAPAELADNPAEDDDADGADMEAPFKIAAPPRRAATRAKVSTAAKHMLYGADTPQPPPRPRRRAKSCAPAAVAIAPPARGPQGQADQEDLDDLDDEKWPY